MRLTCPTCGATYEIDASLVPPGGRDVQCSNCGSSWFQDAPSRSLEPAAAPRQALPQPQAKAEAKPETPRRRRPDEAVLDVLRQEREHEARARAREGLDRQEASEAAPEPKSEPNSEDDPARRGARERARMAAAAALARSRDKQGGAANQSGPETAKPGSSPISDDGDEPQDRDDSDDQDAPANAPDETSDAISRALIEAESGPDLGDNPRDTLGDRMAAKPVAPPDTDRRARLPDIEEINSTLRPDERAAEQAARDGEVLPSHIAEVERRTGFRLGFSLVLLAMVLCLLAYVFAAPIAQAVPALAEPLEAYRAWGDSQRAGLDRGAERLADWLTSSTE